MEKKDFLLFIENIKDLLFRFCLRLLQNKQDAEDAVQDVLIKLWKMRNELNTYKNKDAFAMTVVKNHCLDKIRTRKNYTSDYAKIPTNFNDDLNKTIDSAEGSILVNQQINRLPEQQRMIIQLRDIEEMEYEKIAEITGISENTIRVNLFRARKKIKENIEKIYSYEKQ